MTAQGTLPWSWYTDPELLRHEQERKFRRGWQYAGPVEHAVRPGDFFTCSRRSDYAGNRSGLLDEGRLLPESERLLAHFQSLVREALS